MSAPLHNTPLRTLGRSGLTTGCMGFGGYRVNQSEEHAKALRLALASGIRLIDTSSNYTDGASEALIGGVLAESFQSGTLARGDVVVISKAGYIQGANMNQAKQRAGTGNPYPEVVEYSQDCWHSIHPDFLAEQLTKSLERLKLDHIDIYLLHNPEYFLSAVPTDLSAAELSSLRHTFYERVRRAFLHLEGEADRGRIRFYGVSSNSFILPESAQEHTSITRMLDIAREIGLERGDADSHRFAVVQLPANLIEHQGFTEKNHGGRSAIAYAAEHNLGVLVNRPLNAFSHHGLTHLSDLVVPEITVALSDQLDQLKSLERRFREKLAPHVGERDGRFGMEAFTWSQWFSEIVEKKLPPDQWPFLEQEVIRPHLSQALRHFTSLLSQTHPVEWAAWRNEYGPQVLQTLQMARAIALAPFAATTNSIRGAISPHLPEAVQAESLTVQALLVLINSPGVSCVLNGMRQANYVQIASTVMNYPPFDLTPEIFEAVQHLD